MANIDFLEKSQVLPPDDPAMQQHLDRHAAAFPLESTPLLDSAVSLGGKPRTPTNAPFHPVGHISLDTDVANPELADASKGIYHIATFYVSRALQGAGLGRAAMDLVEGTAMKEPLCAKVLTLGTTLAGQPGLTDPEVLSDTGMEPSKVCQPFSLLSSLPSFMMQ